MPKSSRFRHQKWHKGTRCTRHKRGSSWPWWRTSCWNTYPSQNILSTPVAQGLVEFSDSPDRKNHGFHRMFLLGKINPFIRIQTAHFLVAQNHPSELFASFLVGSWGHWGQDVWRSSQRPAKSFESVGRVWRD